MIARRIPVALAATSLLFGAACGSEASGDTDTGPGTGGTDTGGGGADAGGMDSGGIDSGSTDTTPDLPDASDDTGPVVEPSETLEEAAQGWCETLEACDPALFAELYGDVDGCAQYTQYYLAEFMDTNDADCVDAVIAYADCLRSVGACVVGEDYGEAYMYLSGEEGCFEEYQALDDSCYGGYGEEFECYDGTTVEDDAVCDGVEDCPDGEDESELLCDPALPPFICDDGAVIEWDAVCDDTEDCVGGEDETDLACDGFPIGSWECNDGTPILHAQMCDGVEDCPVGEDEDPSVCGP